MTIEELTEECSVLKSMGVPAEQIVSKLKEHGLSITESMKVVRASFDVSLGEAKRIVASSPIWKEVVKASEPAQDAFYESLSDQDLRPKR